MIGLKHIGTLFARHPAFEAFLVSSGLLPVVSQEAGHGVDVILDLSVAAMDAAKNLRGRRILIFLPAEHSLLQSRESRCSAHSFMRLSYLFPWFTQGQKICQYDIPKCGGIAGRLCTAKARKLPRFLHLGSSPSILGRSL